MIDRKRFGFGQLVVDGKRLPFVKEVFRGDCVMCADRGGFGEQGWVAGDVGAKVLREAYGEIGCHHFCKWARGCWMVVWMKGEKKGEEGAVLQYESRAEQHALLQSGQIGVLLSQRHFCTPTRK